MATTNVSFGTRLRSILDERNLSQAQLARDSGLDRSEINRLCHDRREPRPHEVLRIARALGLGADALLEGVDLPDEFEEVRAELGRISSEFLMIEQASVAAVADLQAEREQIEDERARWKLERDELYRRISELQESHARELGEITAEIARHSQLQTEQLVQERERWARDLASAKRRAAEREQELLVELSEIRDSESQVRQALAKATARVKRLENTVAQLHVAVGNLQGQRILTGVLGALGGLMLLNGSRDDR